MSRAALALPRLKPSVDIRHVDGRLLVLRADVGGDDFELEGDTEWISTFLRLLDGERTTDALQSALSNAGLAADPDTIQAALSELEHVGLLEDASSDHALSDYERDRFGRQLAYFADIAKPGTSAAEGQRRLREATVCVLGVGGLGSWTAYGLACAGVGRLRLVDGDDLELSNLNRQVLYAEADIGKPKAELAAARLRSFAPRCIIEPWVVRLADEKSVADAIAGADLVIDAADWPPHKIDRWVNSACFAAGLPFLAMSQQPPKVRVGPLYAPGMTGCYLCLEAGFRSDYEDYDRVVATAPAASRASTFGPACATVGAISASEAVHFLTRLSQPNTLGCGITMDLSDLTVTRMPVRQVVNCPVCSTEVLSPARRP
jgi:molybdopterin-synthase adenylyltransferase